MSLKLIFPLITSFFLVLGCNMGVRINKAFANQNKGIYLIQFGNRILAIDPSSGGRIASLKINDKDFLTDSTVNNFNWGSTFWISPQSDWDWPPSAEVDNKPYSIKIANKQVIMISPMDPTTGFVITKVFSVNRKHKSYLLNYIITNHSAKPQKFAPWEVTRVHINGLSFFPYGEGVRSGGLLPFTSEKDGISWFQYQSNDLPIKGDRQLYSDGAEGWLAHVTDRMILIKKFPAIPFEKIAPKEGEVEWYASPVALGKSYVEIEHQGAYEQIQPGESTSWQVEWFLRILPSNIKSSAENAELVNYVRQVIK